MPNNLFERLNSEIRFIKTNALPGSPKSESRLHEINDSLSGLSLSPAEKLKLYENIVNK